MNFTIIEISYLLLYLISLVISLLFITKFIIETFNYKRTRNWIITLIAFLIMFLVYFIDYTWNVKNIILRKSEIDGFKFMTSFFYMISFILLTLNFSKLMKKSNKHGKDSEHDN